MERTERLFEILGDIDEELIAAAAPKPTAQAPVGRVWRKWLPAVACFCLAAVIGIAAWRMTPASPLTEADRESPSTSATSGKYPPADTVKPAQTTDPNKATESASHAISPVRTTGYEFKSFSVGDITYTCQQTNRKLDPALRGERMGETDVSNHRDTHHLTYYALVDIDPACAVAAVFEGEEDIYLYVNTGYRAGTLGELLNDLSLRDHLTFGDVTLTYARDDQLHTAIFDSPSPDTVWEHLLDDPTLADVRESDSSFSLYPATSPEMIRISAHMSSLGYDVVSMWVSRNGYLVMYIFGHGYVFPMEDTRLSRYVTSLVGSGAAYEQTVGEIPPCFEQMGQPTPAYTFNTLTVGGTAYTCRTYIYGIDGKNVGQKLGEMTVENGTRTRTLTYYELVGVSASCGIAVRFEGDSVYYSYLNEDFYPATLGELIDGLGLRAHLRAGDVTVTHTEATVTTTTVFADPAEQLLWDHLLTDTAAGNVCDPDHPTELSYSIFFPPLGQVSIPISLPALMHYDFRLWVTEDGYLHTDLFGTLKSFPIDGGQVTEFVNTLTRLCPDRSVSVADAGKPGKTEPWESMELPKRYSGFEAGDITYSAVSVLDASQLGRPLGNAHAVGYDAGGGAVRRTPVVYYAIESINPVCAVAVQFTEEGNGEYYVYSNKAYVPRTLGDLVSDLNLRETMVLKEFFVMDWNARNRLTYTHYYLDAEDTAILDRIFTDPSIINIDEELKRYPNLGASAKLIVDIPLLGLEDVWLWVNDKKGYLFTYNFDTRKVFTIGPDAVLALLDYVKTNHVDDMELEETSVTRVSFD